MAEFLSNINSFPTTKMGSVNKLITENSLTRLINRLIDVDGFIITDGLAEKESDAVQSEIIGVGGKHLKINKDLLITDDQHSEIIFRDDLLEFVIRGYYFSAPVSELRNILKTAAPSVTSGLYARIFIDATNVEYPELVGQQALEEGEYEGKNLCVQFFVSPPNSKPVPTHPILSEDDSTPISGLGDEYFYYDLMLMKYVTGSDILPTGIYLPFDSLCKFDTHSQSVIDGGEISFTQS